MPRYLFHVRKDGSKSDSTSVELAGLEEARVEAARCLGEEILEHPRDLWDAGEWYVDVADESGLILFSVFSAVYEAASMQSSHR